LINSTKRGIIIQEIGRGECVEDKKGVSKRVEQLRSYLGFNQEDFGAKLGMTKSAISKIEKGWAALTEKNAMLICQRFGANKDWLLTGRGEMLQDKLEADAIIHMLDVADPLDAEIIRAYLRLDEKYRAAFRELLKELVGR
jgi:transcriptional regulator with XRE-family HTH domain